MNWECGSYFGGADQLRLWRGGSSGLRGLTPRFIPQALAAVFPIPISERQSSQMTIEEDGSFLDSRVAPSSLPQLPQTMSSPFIRGPFLNLISQEASVPDAPAISRPPHHSGTLLRQGRSPDGRRQETVEFRAE